FKLQELGLPLPAALACCSPWADLLAQGDTINTLQYVDSAAISYTGLITGMAKLYGGAGDWRDPLISPVYGDFTGFPPTLLISGARDLFLSDTVRVHRQLRRRGAWADLQVFEGLSHAEHLYLFDSPESEEVFAEIRRFFDRFLGK
ncbi:MAG: alpha/beta hydrolase, partial [Cyanobacteriota bacterium]|nr:alpha/beta hydrolase [Cyanobacteriota bacterium]